jgi:hypothetical protein
MNLDALALASLIAIGACTILMAALLLYMWWLLLDLRDFGELSRAAEIRRYVRRPEVARDTQGKPIRTSASSVEPQRL